MSNDFDTRPIIVMDFETTGIDPKEHDIIEIGAIRVNNRLQELSTFEEKIFIQRYETIQLEALAVNGYDSLVWRREATDLSSAIKHLTNFCIDGVFCAWNLTFEYRFLTEAFYRTGIVNPFLERRYSHHIDIPSIAWALGDRDMKSLSYDEITANLGLAPEVKPHRAINGARHNLEVLRVLLPDRSF